MSTALALPVYKKRNDLGISDCRRVTRLEPGQVNDELDTSGFDRRRRRHAVKRSRLHLELGQLALTFRDRRGNHTPYKDGEFVDK